MRIHSLSAKPNLAIAVLAGTLLGRPSTVHAQTSGPSSGPWTAQTVPANASLRGLSVVDANVLWASGTGGTFLWTDDGGANWHAGTVPGAQGLDFRAVHAVSLDTAYLMVAAQDTARIYYTTDRGAHWTTQYDSAGQGLFFDAIAFFDRAHGLVLGDPTEGHFTLFQTSDAGAHWTRVPVKALPAALTGEAAFAASGTALVTHGSRHAWFATGGGDKARVFRTADGGATWQVSETPIVAGRATRGIFSLAFRDTLHGVAVGGNYAAPDSNAVAAAYTNDGGVTWTPVPATRATGYLSGVAYVTRDQGKTLLAVGTPGTSISRDGGHTWQFLSGRPFNVVTAGPGGRVWAAGERGVIATAEFNSVR